MSFVVCLIDDALLRVNREPKLLSECQINNKILDIAPEEDAEEHEKNLQAFIESIISQTDMTLYGYTNPTFYNSNIGQHPAFDVVIYDWDYAGSGGAIDPAEQLEKLINDSHCFVYVYSHMDDGVHKEQIEAIKAKNPHRVDFLLKGETNSAETLKSKIQEYKSSSFSAQFAQQFRVNASKSVEKILVRLAHLGTEKFHKMMGTNDEEKKKDLVEFISEKFKNELMQMSFSLPPVETTEEGGSTTAPETVETVASPEEPSIKELWHYRMYSTISDERVRKGDIYKNIDDEYILIMTPNCQLVKYHDNKTFGILNYCNLIATSNLENTIKRLVLHEGTAKAQNTCLGKSVQPVYSLINQVGSKESAPFILPYVTLEDVNLVLFPKMFTYTEIQVKNQQAYLKRDELAGYTYVTSLSEPFLSELIKEIYDKLERNGVPNFSDQVQKEINSILLGSFTP